MVRGLPSLTCLICGSCESRRDEHILGPGASRYKCLQMGQQVTAWACLMAPDCPPLIQTLLRLLWLPLLLCIATAGHSSLVDGLEDEAEEYMWQWELRDAKHLPKEHRGAAAAAKKRAARVLDRLKAVSSAIKLLEAHGGGKASARLSKALDALQRVKVGRVPLGEEPGRLWGRLLGGWLC